MGKNNVNFDYIEIEEFEFHQFESSISINDLDINKIIVSNKFPPGKQDFKYFIGYKDTEKLDLYPYSIHK